MVRQTPEFEREGAEEPATLPLAPDVAERLERFGAAVEVLLARRPGGRSPLLDARLIPDEAVVGGGRMVPEAWNLGVFEALLAGEALDQALPETEAATACREALYTVLDALRHEEAEALRELRDDWPHIRAELRRFVLGLAREDDPEDARALDQALGACGLRPLSQPEPNRVGATLRGVLKELLEDAGARRGRRDLRRTLARTGVRSVPREARFYLAMKLVERPVVRPDADSRIEVAEERAFLADPTPTHRPQLPAPLVGRVLLLLAALDVLEARQAPGSTWRGRSAYNVLRRVSGEGRWGDELRAAMDAVLDGLIDEKEIEYVLAVVARARLSSASRAAPGVATKPPADADRPETARFSADGRANQGGEGFVAADRVPSPAPPAGEIVAPAAEVVVVEGVARGDETGGSEPAHKAGVGRVSSPLPPAEHLAAQGARVSAPTGGDGTETSEAASRAGLSEVSSPGGLRAGSPAAPAGQERKDSDGASAATPRSPQPPGPEGLALAHLMLAVRAGRPVPSRAECARAAGVSRQATMKWNSFDAAWRNARAAEKGHVRRGYRDARTGDLEAEDDNG